MDYWALADIHGQHGIADAAQLRELADARTRNAGRSSTPRRDASPVALFAKGQVCARRTGTTIFPEICGALDPYLRVMRVYEPHGHPGVLPTLSPAGRGEGVPRLQV